MDSPLIDVQDVKVFEHQIAGHGALLKTAGKVCKPVLENSIESEFYKQVPLIWPTLLPFLPRFFGILPASSAHVGSSASTPLSVPSSLPPPHSFSKKEDKSLPLSSSAAHNGGDGSLRLPIPLDAPKLKERIMEYIVLEDLTLGMQSPCIMDIKIGTREYGDDATEAKKKHMIEKAASTTSAALGARISAMQIWDIDKNEYKRMSKIEGRAVTVHTFTETIERFFHINGCARREVIEFFKDRIQQLLSVFENPDSPPTYNFFSSSLLFVYDGPEEMRDAEKPSALRAQLRMVDFAHAHPLAKPEDFDNGYIVGLKSVLSSLDFILHE